MGMSLPLKTSKQFLNLIEVSERLPGEFPHLRTTVLAQMALESGWGTSDLAKNHLNYAGMKWREIMNRYAVPVSYAAHDGRTRYCKFNSNLDFWNGYWHRLDAMSAYDGWRDHTATGDDFIAFIGPIWVGLTEAARNQEYVQKVRDVRARNFGS